MLGNNQQNWIIKFEYAKFVFMGCEKLQDCLPFNL